MRLALAAVAALALAASACGGVESEDALWVESEPDFAEAAEKTRSLSSYAYQLRGDEFHLGDREEYVCEGWVDTVRPAERLICAGGQMDAWDLRLVGDTSYEWNARTAKWQSLADENLIAGYSYTYPATYFDFVKSADGARRVGEEDVRGEPTVRYLLTFDCEPGDQCIETEFEAWVDGDGLIRRVEAFNAPNTIRFDFFDFDRPVDIEEPSADEIEAPRDRVEVPCGSQPAGPITVRDAIDTLGRHGFDLEPSEFKCMEDVAEHLVSRSEWEDVVASSGYVICTVSAEGWEGGAPHVDLIHSKASNHVENLGCLLAADGGRAAEPVAAFEDALKELKREHGS